MHCSLSRVVIHLKQGMDKISVSYIMQRGFGSQSMVRERGREISRLQRGQISLVKYHCVLVIVWIWGFLRVMWGDAMRSILPC